MPSEPHNPGNWLGWLMVIPLAGVVLTSLFTNAARWWGLAASVLMAGCVFCQVPILLDSGPYSLPVGGWPAPLGITLRADGLSVTMLLMVAVVGLGIGVYASVYFPARNPNGRPQYFWPLWMFLLSAFMAVLLSGDLFNIYVSLELLGLAAVALVTLEGGLAALEAGIRYLFVNLLGSLVYLLGVVLVYATHATIDLDALGQSFGTTSSDSFAAVAMMMGLLLKTALFPLHFWLPPAHSSAPVPVSASLSGLVVKASFYVVMRLWFDLIRPGAMAAELLGVLGSMAVLWGCLQALRQERMKLLIAYSTVAQVGYLFLVLPLCTGTQSGGTAWAGGLYFALSHAFAKSALFLAAGNLVRSVGHDRIQGLRGVGRAAPLSCFAMALAGMTSAGLPPSGGFVGKWLMLTAALREGQWLWAAVLLLGSLLAVGYLMRLLRPALRREIGPGPGPCPPILEWTAFVLGLMGVLLGFFSSLPIRLLEAGAPFPGSVLPGGGL